MQCYIRHICEIHFFNLCYTVVVQHSTFEILVISSMPNTQMKACKIVHRILRVLYNIIMNSTPIIFLEQTIVPFPLAWNRVGSMPTVSMHPARLIQTMKLTMVDCTVPVHGYLMSMTQIQNYKYM